jgi:hypothetical protein
LFSAEVHFHGVDMDMDNFILYFNFKIWRRHKLSVFPCNTGYISELLCCSTCKYQYVSFIYGAEQTAWKARPSGGVSMSGALPQRSDSPDARPQLPKYAAGWTWLNSYCFLPLSCTTAFSIPWPPSLQRTDKIHHIN